MIEGTEGGTGVGDQARDAVTFGIKTTPMRVGYEEILRVWEEADELPDIEDAWLWDHLMPVAGPKDGQVLEGWTLLAALAARTRRLRLGLLVTSNRILPQALGSARAGGTPSPPSSARSPPRWT